MNNQFRSRVPGGYSIDVLDDNTGVCCTDATGGFTAASRHDCFVLGGWYAANSSLCPKVNRGNCCDNGIIQATDKTICECKALNTNYTWVASDSPCPSALLLAQTQGACCHWGLSGGVYTNLCQTVDNDEQCAALHQGTADGLLYTFYQGNSCLFNGGTVVCNGTKKLTDTELATVGSCIPNTLADCNVDATKLGNCCTVQTDNTRLCSITTKDECLGFWNYLDGVKPCSTGSLCSGVYFEYYAAGVTASPPTASLTTLQSSTNTLEALPSSNIAYQGGLYVGIFEPGTPVNPTGTVVFGNQFTGAGINYTARGTGKGTTNKKWILIAAPEDIEVAWNETVLSIGNTVNTSIYDGFYGTEQTPNYVYSSINNLTYNGFSDWYIPSMDELAFYFKSISSDAELPDGISHLSEDYYLTSTLFETSSGQQEISGKYFVYVQSAKSENYGATLILPRNKQVKIRPFRRIYLGV